MNDEPLNKEREYAEHAGVVLESMGLPRAFGKLLGYFYVCDPPQQTSAQLAEALGLSKGSVSTGTRMLESGGLIRRVALAGVRGRAFELTADPLVRNTQGGQYRRFEELMRLGLDVVGDDPERGRRLRRGRDFYAFLNRELPKLVERFEAEYPQDASRGGPPRAGGRP